MKRPSDLALTSKVLNIAVLVASLGYFVDMFDFLTFNVVRVKSLTDLGLSGDALTHSGLFINNCQLAGVLLGAYLSGLIGDKLGRKTSLFLSIIIYSLGSLLCATVTSVPVYSLARFIVGVGIAGELGAGVTLISEKIQADRRGLGVMIFLVAGFLGVVTAASVSALFGWRTTYIICGVSGLILLFTRTLLSESDLFTRIENQASSRGGLRPILRNRALFKKYIGCILVMIPGVFVPQIMWTLSPELGKAAGVIGEWKAGTIIAIGFGAGALGGFLAMMISEKWRSRRYTVAASLALSALCFFYYIFCPPHSLSAFYVANALLGTSMSLWVLGGLWSAENFGTNIRATAATTIPNFARGTAIVMNIVYAHLKMGSPLMAAAMIGAVVYLFTFVGWAMLPETYGKDLDYVEEQG